MSKPMMEQGDKVVFHWSPEPSPIPTLGKTEPQQHFGVRPRRRRKQPLTPEQFRARWGDAVFATLDASCAAQLGLPEADVRFLVEAGLPRETGFYDIGFDFPPLTIPTLSKVRSGKRALSPEWDRYLVLGGNRVAIICVDPDRGYSVFGVSAFGDEEPYFISSSVRQMALTFLAMRDAIPLVAKDEITQAELLTAVGRIDKRVVSEGGDWWDGMIYDMFMWLPRTK